MTMPQCVIICRSIHDVMKSEQLLLDNDIANDLIPVPREISSNCGMAIEVATTALAEVLSILRQRQVNIHSVYRQDSGKYRIAEGI